jgi:hypothetical protein
VLRSHYGNMVLDDIIHNEEQTNLPYRKAKRVRQSAITKQRSAAKSSASLRIRLRLTQNLKENKIREAKLVTINYQ